MIELTTDEIAMAVGGRRIGTDTVVRAVAADSRALPADALFVALLGDRDGHAFVPAALTAGAAAVMVEREDAVPDGASAVVVGDTWAALRALASEVRGRVGPMVVAITGSVGKTTTKDLVAAACGDTHQTLASTGSHNNELGVPETLLRLRPSTEVVVVEVGARGIGHIALLMPMVQPDVAIVTAVGQGAHLSEFGSLDAIAIAKAELVLGLRSDGVAVLNLDDPLVAGMATKAPGRVVTFSAAGNPAADFRALEVVLDGAARPSFVVVSSTGQARVQLPLAGVHHVGNALAALAAATCVGVPLEDAAAGLTNAKVSAWRSEVLDVAGVRILSDAYNANPTSMLAALDALAAMDVTGRRWAVLGTMAELGADHVDGHRRVGRRAAEVADVVLVVGGNAEGIAEAAHEAASAEVRVAADVVAAAGILDAQPGDAVLVKASRVAGLERIVVSLMAGVQP